MVKKLEERLFFSYNPDDVTLLEAVGGLHLRQILLSFFQSDDHAVVFVADTAFLQCLSHEGTVFSNGNRAKSHLAFFQFVVLFKRFFIQGMTEGRELFVAADNLQTVARIHHVLSVRNVQTPVAAQDAADVHAEFVTEVQVFQRLSHPSGVGGHVEIRNVNVSVEKLSLIEWPFMSMNLCLDVARTKILYEQPFHVNALILDPA